MTQKISRTRARWSESLINSFVHLRAVLVRLSGIHVAVWALLGCKLMFGLYLIVAREALFGAPVEQGEFVLPIFRYLWNKFTDSSDVLLLLLSLFLLLGLKFRQIPVVWWASSFSASIWAIVWLLACLSYVFGYSALASVCLTGIVPFSLSVFTSLRLSADSSDLAENKARFRRSDDLEGAEGADAK